MALLASCGSSSSVTTDSANSGPSTTWPSTTSSTSPVTGSTTDNSDTKRSHKFTAEVWADNWFSLYVNGQMVAEDSIPITTERSFNAETISFDAAYPLNVAIISKDYIENETGLEYIGL
ncbi:MAG: PEBP family protein, partial [Acidimicrobiia bacterium]|nr:PEBP family protein [Acidimicrobiia bacterium]